MSKASELEFGSAEVVCRIKIVVYGGRDETGHHNSKTEDVMSVWSK